MKEWSLTQNKKCWTVALNVNEEVSKEYDGFAKCEVTKIVSEEINEVLRITNIIKSALV